MLLERLLASSIKTLCADRAALLIGKMGAELCAGLLNRHEFQADAVRQPDAACKRMAEWAAQNTQVFHVLIMDDRISPDASAALRQQARNGEIKGLSPHATIERSDQMPQVISPNTGNRGRDRLINFVVRLRTSLVEIHLREKGEPVPADLPQSVIQAYGSHIRTSQFGEPGSGEAVP